MGLSARAVAAQLGVSHTAVNKAAARQRIPRESDGSFDLDKVKAAWDANVDIHQQQRGTAAKHRASSPISEGHPKPPPEDAPTGDEQRLQVQLAYVQLEQAKIRLARDQFEQQQREKKRDAAEERKIEARAAVQKQALLAWPSQVSADLAAQLNVDRTVLRKALDASIREFLSQSVRLPIPPDSE